MIFIGDELAVGVDRGPHLCKMSRTIIVPTMLVPAHVLHPDRPSDRLRQDGGGLRGVFVAASPIGAGAFVVLHANLVRRHAKNPRQHLARVVDVLGRRPHQRTVGPHIGERAVWPERKVALIRAEIRRRAGMRRARKAFVDVAAIGDHGIGRLLRAHLREQVGIARQFRTFLPGHLERLRGFDCIPFALGHHADEIAFAHHPRRRDVLDRAFIDTERLGARAEGALPARQHHAAVQHPGHAQMVNQLVAPAHLVRQVDARHPRADQPVAVRRLLRCRAREFNVERFVAEKLAVFDRAESALAFDRHNAVGDHQAVDLHAETTRRQQQQGATGFRRRRAQLRTAAFDR